MENSITLSLICAKDGDLLVTEYFWNCECDSPRHYSDPFCPECGSCRILENGSARNMSISLLIGDFNDHDKKVLNHIDDYNAVLTAFANNRKYISDFMADLFEDDLVFELIWPIRVAYRDLYGYLQVHPQEIVELFSNLKAFEKCFWSMDRDSLFTPAWAVKTRAYYEASILKLDAWMKTTPSRS